MANMERNPFEWIRRKFTTEMDSNLYEHKLSWGKQPLKFYKNISGRYSVSFNGKHICTCKEEQIVEIQKHFDNRYGKETIDDISEELKLKYNEKIKRKMKKVRRHKNYKTYRESKLQFETKPRGRVQVRVNDNGKVHTICQCYPDQKDEVIRKYDILKKTNDLEILKKKMKDEYNLRGKSKDVERVKHVISVDNDGAVYKDGKYIKVSKSIYDLVNGLIN